MRTLIRATTTLAALTAAVLTAAPAAAQSDILLRLRSGSPLGDRFRVDSASGFVAKGVLGVGIIPFTGAGERAMWYPYKASFRAGGVDGTQWDDSNTGFYSFATGNNTTASGYYSIATGGGTKAQGNYSVAMGQITNADGSGAIALGTRSTADADYSVAIGQRASTNGHAGAIVFADGSTTDSLEASANNQFSVRAAGGYRLYSNATETTGVTMSAGGSSWVVVSDRNRKQDFMAVDGENLLMRLRSVPVTTWRYRDEADRTTLHMGPMAQDWHRAFGFSSDDRTINMSDLDGVNLAAVKALEARTAELQAKSARVERLEAQLSETQRRLAALEAAVLRIQQQTQRP
ncbi:MAG TPA: tail fiber domain-containing protein [Longimicrobiaceae bacterium]|nr:tail fiber domain-containing protein [Longimicrobiaceae bacterium]